MSKAPLPSGEVVDTCVCGVFADYFDGEPRAISKAVRLGSGGGASSPPAQDVPPRCAACGEAMALLRFGQGPALHRCHGCASVFMTPAMLTALRRHEETAPEETRATLLQRIAVWLDSI